MFVCLLGSPLILIDQRPVEKLRRKNRALLYYLAAHTEPVTRDQLLALFWPDDERPAAQQTLRTLLHDLRSALGSAFLQVEGDHLSLSPGVGVDARELAAVIDHRPAVANAQDMAQLSAVLLRCRGDFLDGFTLPDAPPFDDWVQAERETYRAQAIRGFSLLSQLQEAQGDFPAALATLARALAMDPLREELQRDTLRLHYWSGDRTGAIRQYEALCKLLDEELGVPPMPETRAVYDAIISDRLSTAAPLRPAAMQPETAPLPKAAPLPAAKPQPLEPTHRPPAATRSSPPGLAVAHTAAAAPPPLFPFTGRAAELETLRALRSAQKFILVEGAPGIGKTRLVNEFLAGEFLAAPSSSLIEEALVLRGVAHELEQGLPYQPVVDALRGLLAHPEWPALRNALEIQPIWLAEITRLLPELQNQFTGLPPASQELDESRLWEGIHQFLQSLSGQRPVRLFLDDLHWADFSTLGLVGYLARRALTEPVTTQPGMARPAPALLLIGATRPVEGHSRLALLINSLAHEGRLEQLSLAPLSDADTRSVAEKISPAVSAAARAALSAWLVNSAEGSPYFLTELIRHAYQNQVLRADGSFDEAALASTQVLPPTIQNLTLSRLIRLSEDARHVLEAAAVIGREFNFDLVYRVLSLLGASGEPALLDALDELRAAVLIQPRGGDRFAFDHSLTMNVVLQDMGEARGRMLHRQAAQALEQLHAARIEPIAGVIATHYAKGGDPARACQYAFIAGQYAAGLAAWEEALAFYEQALSVEAKAEQRAAISIAAGTARFHKGDFAQALDAFRAAIALARPLGDLERLEAAYMGMNLSLLPQSRFAEAIALGRDLAQSGPPELAICAHFIWASGLSVESAHPDEAEAHLRLVERLMSEHAWDDRSANDHPKDGRRAYAGQVSAAHVRYQLAGVIGQQGKSAQAVALYREALGLVQQDASALDLLRQIMLYNNLAYHLHLLGDPAAAEFIQAGMKLARERGSLTHMPYLLSTAGEIALSSADLDQAEAYFREGLRLAELVPISERIAGLTANLGLVARQRGLDEVARQHLTKALDLADRLGNRHLAVRIRGWLAPLLPSGAARARLEEARAIAQESGFRQLCEEIARIEQEI